jgi:hypothetical protein
MVPHLESWSRAPHLQPTATGHLGRAVGHLLDIEGDLGMGLDADWDGHLPSHPQVSAQMSLLRRSHPPSCNYTHTGHHPFVLVTLLLIGLV